mmetsp:Transcript_83906/g.271112  ORF Transcript_83906/g.271112 Transcript_83906/m.271112 type:complete len:317 (-) Transcript_83906:8-958(-)
MEEEVPGFAGDVLVVRAMSGGEVLSLPRSAAEGLAVAGLLRRLRSEMAAEAPAHATVGMNLVLGVKVLRASDLLDKLWSADCHTLDFSLVLQDTMREDDIRQAADIFLDNIATCDSSTVVEQLAQIRLTTRSGLEVLVSTLFSRTHRAFKQTNIVPDNPLHGADCLDVMLALADRCPAFALHDGEGGRHRMMTFRRVLFDITQHEFESNELRLRPEEMDNTLALVRLIGNLFLRGEIAVAVIEQIVNDMLGQGCDHTLTYVDCICELLTIVRPKLQTSRDGMALLPMFMVRLLHLSSDHVSVMALREHFSTAVEDV